MVPAPLAAGGGSGCAPLATDLLVITCGWTSERYETWLAEALNDLLLPRS